MIIKKLFDKNRTNGNIYKLKCNNVLIKMINLDQKDKRILIELIKNSRQSNSQIAKKIGLSKQAVGYRIDNLLKNKVITGFYCVIDTNKIGYNFYRLALKLKNTGIKKEKEIIPYLKGKKNIAWIIKTRGKWDLAIGLWCKSILEFEEILGNFLNKFNQFIEEKYSSIAFQIYDLGNRFILNHNITKIELNIEEKKEKVDKIGMNILSELSLNARENIITLSKKIKISPRLLIYRIKKLEKNNIIRAYRPILNFEKFGLTYYKLFLTLNQKNSKITKELEDFLEKNKQVIYTTKSFGSYDFEFECLFQKDLELFQFIDKIRETFPDLITNLEISIFEKVFKQSFFPNSLETS